MRQRESSCSPEIECTPRSGRHRSPIHARRPALIADPKEVAGAANLVYASAMRIVLTGHTGLIGRPLCDMLVRRGFDVHCLSRRPRPVSGATVYQTDLLVDDVAELLHDIGPTHLLHLAWHVEPSAWMSSPVNLDWVAASLRLVRAFAIAGGTRFVGAESCAEYDWSYPLLHEEDTPRSPDPLYGAVQTGAFRPASEGGEHSRFVHHLGAHIQRLWALREREAPGRHTCRRHPPPAASAVQRGVAS